MVTIDRFDKSDEGSFGWLNAGEFYCFSGELPDRGNQRNISCILAGKYRALWTLSPRFKRKMYIIVPVDGRSGIRIHLANFMGDRSLGKLSQLNGCISFGERLGWISGQKALLRSAPAVRRFEKYMNYQPFDLEIRDVFDSRRAA